MAPVAKKHAARIEVFRPGTFTPMVGDPVSYSADDLRAIAASYDREAAPAPIVVGHPTTDAPAYGWVDSLEFDEEAQRLYATTGDVEPAFADAVKAGRYRKVSMSFFKPDASNNPRPGQWYPKHIGFLGGAAPAVSGLKPVAFSGDAPDTLTFAADFGEPGFEQSASLFRGLRDWMIEQFGLETADKVLPAYRLEWLDDTEVAKPAARTAFSEPAKEPVLTKPTDAAFAEREAGLATREQKIAERERELRHEDNLAFAEQLATDGRIAPVQKDKVAALLDAVPDDAAVSFSGEAEKPLRTALREILAAQPKIVSFGAADLGQDPDADDGGVVSFAADGKQVDPEGLKLHAKALAYQRAHPGTDYAAAIDAVR